MGAERRAGLDLADFVTLARLPLAALLWLHPRWTLWVLGIVALAAASDVLDGWLARRRAEHIAFRAKRGAVLDGFVDKVFAVSCFALVWIVSAEPPILLLAIVLREMLMVPAMLAWSLLPAERRRRIEFHADSIGKLTTLAQFVALLLAYLAWPGHEAAAVLAGLLGAWAMVRYAVRAYRMSRE